MITTKANVVVLITHTTTTKAIVVVPITNTIASEAPATCHNLQVRVIIPMVTTRTNMFMTIIQEEDPSFLIANLKLPNPSLAEGDPQPVVIRGNHRLK